MLAIDREGKIEVVNQQVERLFGYSREELLGLKIEVLIPARYANVHVGHRSKFFADPLTRPMGFGLELAGRRKDGSEFPVDISLSSVVSKLGPLVVAAIRDITERRRVEDRALSLQQELREKAALVDLAHDAILVLDPADGTIRYWNQGAEALYQYSATEAIGRIGGDLLKRVAPTSFRELVARATEADHWDGRLQHTTKGGDKLVVESRWAILRDEAGGPTGILEVNRDITARLRAEDSLQEANELLEARIDELESFSSSVSHDLRTPLRAINGFVDVLVEEAPDQLNAEALDALAEIRGNAIRMGQLIDDLLAFARLGMHDLEKRDVDMFHLAKRTSEALMKLADGRPIDLTIGQMPRCHGDPSLLEHVWTNLLANAIKFTAGRLPAVITAGAEEHDGRTVYFVRDNGVGFNMAHAGKLFGVFQRLHASDEFEGTGVGLATVMRICNRHGGTAWAEATLNEGATFYFTVVGGTHR